MSFKKLFICFVGIDGSGKTTQAEMLLVDLKEKGIKAIYVWNRWTPILLRLAITIWKKKVAKDGSDSCEEYAKTESRKRRLLSNPFFRFLWLIFFIFDYGLQVFFKVRIRMLWSKAMISDRTFYDSIIDQEINLNDKKGLLLNRLDSWWMRLLFPRPTMVFCIDCAPEIAFNRKKDAPNLKYLADRRSLYLDLSKRLGWYVIDGTKARSDAHDDIKRILEKEVVLQNV